jgi:hypothetical protein
MVTITVANTGSPSIGRITTRSMIRPSTTAARTAPSATTKTLPLTVVEIVQAI